jgi:hypothetical protein
MNVSQNLAKGDTRLPFISLIGFALHWLDPFDVALGHAQVPACGKRVRGRLHQELADYLRSWDVELLSEAL